MKRTRLLDSSFVNGCIYELNNGDHYDVYNTLLDLEGFMIDDTTPNYLLLANSVLAHYQNPETVQIGRLARKLVRSWNAINKKRWIKTKTSDLDVSIEIEEDSDDEDLIVKDFSKMELYFYF